MNADEKIEFKLTLITEPSMTLRGLDEMRSELFDFLQRGLSLESSTISQPSPSRSLDPAVIGTVSLAILPIVIEKLADLIMKYAELKKDCLVKITIPIKGRQPAEITYNPKTTSKETLVSWMNAISEATQSKKR
jgi:hypothetical protein